MFKKLIITVQFSILLFTSSAQFLISGNSGYSAGNFIASCSDGSIYLTGDYVCNLAVEELRVGPDSCIEEAPTPANFYVLKLDAAGNRLWLTSSDITNTGSQFVLTGVFADDADYLWVAGTFSDSMCIEDQRIKSSSPNDCFVARFNPAGSLDTLMGQFALDASSEVTLNGFTTDNSGNALLYGSFLGEMRSSFDTISHPSNQLFLSRINQIYESEFLIAALDSPVVACNSSAIKALTGDYNKLKMAIEANQATEYKFDSTITVDSTLQVDTTFQADTIFSIDTTYTYFDIIDVDTTIIDIPENTLFYELDDFNTFTYKKRATYSDLSQAKSDVNGNLILLDNVNAPNQNCQIDKYDDNYTKLWSHETNNTNSVVSLKGMSLDTDSEGNIYWGGFFYSSYGSRSFSIGSNTLTADLDKNGLIVKIDNTGNTLWAQSLGSTGGSSNYQEYHDVLSDILVKDATEILGAGYYSHQITLESLTLQNPNGSNNLFIGHIDPFPGFVVDINQPDSVDICEGSSILLEVTPNDNYTYRWKKNGVIISGATGASYTASDSAEYRAEVTNTLNGYVKHSIPVFVHVRNYPEAIITTNYDTVFCAGYEVLMSTIINSGHQYQWLNNNTIIPNATENKYTTGSEGNYRVVTTNPYGCSDTSNTINLTVVDPVAQITNPSDLTLCDGDSVALQAIYNEDYRYQWLKDNNLIIGDTLSELQAKTTGTYTVEVSMLENCTQLSNAVNVGVIPSPPSELTFGGDSVLCNGQQTTLVANSGFNLTYLWMQNNDTIPGENAPILSIDTSGTYRVIVGYEGSCSRWSDAKQVVLHPLPEVNLIIEGDTNFCAGEQALISTLFNSNYSYVWIKNTDTLYSETNHEFVVEQTGNYYAKVISEHQCVNFTPRQGFVVKSSPKATLFYAPDTIFCENNTIELFTYDLPNLSYQWYNNNSPVSGAGNYLLTTGQSGHYSVKVTNKDNSCSSISKTIETVMIPSPTETIITEGDPTICDGDSIHLSVNEYQDGKYQWLLNGYEMYQDTLNYLYATEKGNYRVAIENRYNCKDTAPAVVMTLLANPVPNVTVNGLFLSTNDKGTLIWKRNGDPVEGATNHLFLVEESGIYTVTAHYNNNCSATSEPVSVCNPVPTLTVDESFITASDGAGYQWYFDGERIEGANLQTHRAQVSGYYKVEVTCSGGYSSFTQPVLVCIPVPTITQTDVNVLEASVGNSYQWYFNNNLIPGENARVLQIEKTGTYKVWVENLEGCASLTKPMLVGFQSINQRAAQRVVVHPNPAQTTITLKNLPQGTNSTTMVSIYTLDGQKLLTRQLHSESKNTIAVEQLKPGTYLVYIQQTDFVQVVKMVKH